MCFSINKTNIIMKRTLTILALAVITTFSAKAQDTKKEKGGTRGTDLSIGAEVALPTGDLADFNKVGFGGSAKVAFNVMQNGYITVSGGYISFAGKGTGLTSIPSLNIIPLKAGFRLNLGGFYIEPQLGWTIAKSKGSDNSEASFTWAPNIGVVVAKVLDISARYESFSNDGSTISHGGLRVAYNFNLGGR
jgi:hypothetical protein